MTFDESMADLADVATATVNSVMGQLSAGRLKDEDDITGAIVGALRFAVDSKRISGVDWDASVLTHRKSGQEEKYGGDLLIHTKVKTPEVSYSKGILIQAKKVRANANMNTRAHSELLGQCNKMLDHSPMSYVWNYTSGGMRAASATKIKGGTRMEFHRQCNLTTKRFFLEYFRCTIGDRDISGADADELGVRREPLLRGVSDLAGPRTFVDVG